MDAQPLPEPCKLHLDVLELIINEHRNDPATLAAIALASQSFLRMSRKHLYRSVSIDYCENPYGHDQERQMRLSLASYPHLCSYIRSLRLGLPVTNILDPDLDRILHALVRVEHLHLIGNAAELDYDVTPSCVFPILDSVEPGSMGTTTTRSGRDVGEALKKVFKLRSLKKVKLENIYPLEEVYVSCFTSLKHLELLCVGNGPARLAVFPSSHSDASSVGSASSIAASLSPSTSETSLASHPPPSTPSSSSPPSPTRSSPSYSASHSATSLLSSPDGIAEPNEDRRGTTTEMSLRPAASRPHVTPNGMSSRSFGSSQLPQPSGDPDRALTHGTGGIPAVVPGVAEIGSLKENGRAGWRETAPRKVRLEYLVLNLEHLRPVLDVICRRSASDEKEGSVLDFSGLKQAHIYVWDSDDGHAIWSILETARKTLERLTLRYFDYGDEHLIYHQGFDNLQSLVLGTRTFSVSDQDPFRPLIRFLKDPSKFPSLRQVKISFDLWGCETNGTSWKEVCGYRGWRELDDVFASLDGAKDRRNLDSPALPMGQPSMAVREPQLADNWLVRRFQRLYEKNCPI